MNSIASPGNVMKINEIIYRHPAFNYATEIKDICSPLAALDISYFSHAHIDRNDTLSGIGNSPDFLRLYFEKGYYNYDVHMKDASYGETYYLGDTLKLVKNTQSIQEEFLSFGNGHVFSIVQHHESGTDYYHFATKLGNVGMNAKYLSLIPNLKHFINHFKDKISQQRELSLAYQLRIPLQKESGEFQVMDQSVDIEAFNNLIKTNRHYLAGHHQYLTDRERECMVWLAVGKTYNEIAIILGITPRTVKAHVSSIKEKTNSQTQFQLGALWSKYS